MSARLLRCRDRACRVLHGAVLGRLSTDGGLVLDPAVTHFRCFLDTRRAAIRCPACGVEREFRGGSLCSARAPASDAAAARSTRSEQGVAAEVGRTERKG